jgi:hypothetical protein
MLQQKIYPVYKFLLDWNVEVIHKKNKMFSVANSFEELTGMENVNLTLTDFPIS